MVKPKSFGGLYAAAPAVALAGLVVSGIAKGHVDVHHAAAGMIAGGVAIVAYSLLVVGLHPRLDAVRVAFVGLLAWLVVAADAVRLSGGGHRTAQKRQRGSGASRAGRRFLFRCMPR